MNILSRTLYIFSVILSIEKIHLISYNRYSSWMRIPQWKEWNHLTMKYCWFRTLVTHHLIQMRLCVLLFTYFVKFIILISLKSFFFFSKIPIDPKWTRKIRTMWWPSKYFFEKAVYSQRKILSKMLRLIAVVDWTTKSLIVCTKNQIHLFYNQV